MPARNAASVLPEPVGAAISVSSPAAIAGQPSACGSVGPCGNRRSNQPADRGVEGSERVHRDRVYPMAHDGDRASRVAPGHDAKQERRMQLGVYLNAQHPAGDDPRADSPRRSSRCASIRALGFDSIWGGEHHATPGFHYFPLLPFLQRLAAEADGLWVGTNLILLPSAQSGRGGRDRRVSRRDHRRRFLLGVGLGYRSEEFASSACRWPSG